MSVLIKGMTMPKGCGECKLFDSSHAIGLFAPLGWCRVNGKEIFRVSEKANFCPLVELPPHEDLIDRSTLIVDLMDRGVEGIQMDDWHEIQQAIMDSPVIIKADESDMDSFIRIFEEDDEEDGMDSFIQILKD